MFYVQGVLLVLQLCMHSLITETVKPVIYMHGIGWGELFAVDHCGGWIDRQIITGFYTNQPATPV